MNKQILNFIIIIAFIMILFGIAIPFINLEKISINIKNAGYVASIFSLSGILLYFTALMYQIKEYKLQVQELQKSVFAQTKSREALEEQKRILIEQNTNSLIFGMINGFNEFKARNSTRKLVDEIVDYCQSKFALLWLRNEKDFRLNNEERNRKFAQDIKNLFTKIVLEHDQLDLLKKYTQFIYNVFYLIDQNKENMSRDYFTPFFLSQFSTNENIVLYLSNLVDSEMPRYENLRWSYYSTKEIIDMIRRTKNIAIDFKDIDINILTEEFKKLKQSE